MNAPLPTKVDQIGAYADILSEDFVKETLQRREYVEDNREKTALSCNSVQSNCMLMADKLNGLEETLTDSIKSYDRLTASSEKAADKFYKLSRQIREMSKNLMQQSQLIRENSKRLE